MSVPVHIQANKGEPAQLALQSPYTGVYGTSPGSGRQDRHQHSGSKAARALLRRIQYDSSLNEQDWTVRASNISISAYVHRGSRVQRALPLGAIG